MYINVFDLSLPIQNLHLLNRASDYCRQKYGGRAFSEIPITFTLSCRDPKTYLMPRSCVTINSLQESRPNSRKSSGTIYMQINAHRSCFVLNIFGRLSFWNISTDRTDRDIFFFGKIPQLVVSVFYFLGLLPS